ncbi:hypothetical protein Halha_0577 [Halobacteroides halobius DSM 5150]|uniref:DUF3866 domain-containing protein n=1 Tax=Halobacteroides halobius (strain ATCC 35273 / DSM 5150 / MD-1) TaxID=748449 RepID=L0K699_HALHC|nr:DUF3866 family protein [Halobacteroides halobius]AGB40551.1 hypothetical protein Halha_0577 [Halobacteroides halobius DSM 5150]
MIEIKEGEVSEVLVKDSKVTEVMLLINGQQSRGINYNQLTGPITEGDKVLVNTTATSLNLGTGGYDFILKVKGQETELQDTGHIMKLRYSPYQLQTCSLAEQENANHNLVKEFESLASTPVVVGTLHSMLPAIAVMAKTIISDLNIVYIMTDGAALPIHFSKLVSYLKQMDLIDTTITIGHAFGGDLEAVNIYSGLIGAYKIAKADLVVVTMGPGIVGTGTKYGFSGTEQADILHAVKVLKGIPIAVPRINFADPRRRHYGLSHHSLTNLGKLTLVKSLLGIPNLVKDKNEVINKQLITSGITNRHQVIYRSGKEVITELEKLDFKVTTMGRGINEAKEYFMTTGIAGIIATEKIKGELLDG